MYNIDMISVDKCALIVYCIHALHCISNIYMRGVQDCIIVLEAKKKKSFTNLWNVLFVSTELWKTSLQSLLGELECKG